jgi:two-component system CheB/CheR fusion protein
LKENRGFDFAGYKRSSLTRRVDRRIAQIGVGNYADYLDHLEPHTEEFTALFNNILINVIGFRDAEAWGLPSRSNFAQYHRRQSPNETIRAWSAGCVSGKEAYTLAMILTETLGVDEFRARGKYMPPTSTRKA